MNTIKSIYSGLSFASRTDPKEAKEEMPEFLDGSPKEDPAKSATPLGHRSVDVGGSPGGNEELTSSTMSKASSSESLEPDSPVTSLENATSMSRSVVEEAPKTMNERTVVTTDTTVQKETSSEKPVKEELKVIIAEVPATAQNSPVDIKTEVTSPVLSMRTIKEVKSPKSAQNLLELARGMRKPDGFKNIGRFVNKRRKNRVKTPVRYMPENLGQALKQVLIRDRKGIFSNWDALFGLSAHELEKWKHYGELANIGSFSVAMKRPLAGDADSDDDLD